MIFPSFEPSDLILILILVLLILWLGFITYKFFALNAHYNQLISKTNKKDLETILKDILKLQLQQQQSSENLESHLATIENAASYHFQRIGFLRFNPFSDTGGDQSFALALLDHHKNGIVFSFLHSRDTTRVYAKQVAQGKSKEVPLSEEEEKVVATAQAIKT